MASRAMSPLQAVGRRACLVPRTPTRPVQCAARRLVATSNAKSYAQYQASSAKTTPPTVPPGSSAKPPPKPPPKPPANSHSKPHPRKPVPAVSGVPLPNAPSSTVTRGPDPPAAAAGTTTNTNGDGDGDGDGGDGVHIDWTSSYHGISMSTFPPQTAAVLLAPVDPEDIEVKSDGILYLPEIKYRRILNAAFGPGGWGLAPRGQLMVQDRLVTREYALVVHGRFVAQARGEQQYFNEDGVSTAAEGCKSNALMRCCKDLGIASELWDPRFIRRFKKEHTVTKWVENVNSGKRIRMWLRKDDEVGYPWKESAQAPKR
ncbi:mitochondrial genome maintenance MGM101 [Xylaria palmicola]|nr:mitochondrial genome maintenance MGM101 [Xylaria palmicola]